VVDFYHTAFAEDARAAEYLAKRGITDNHLFSSFKIGFANGTLVSVLPDEGDITSELRELGILNDRGAEHFYGCVTFPLLDPAGNPVCLYGRRVDGMEKADGPPHLYLPGPRRGLFNRQAARLDKEIILTESILDSLTLMSYGIHNTIPSYGVNGVANEHLELLRSSGVETVHICFDGDEPGRSGAQAVAGRLGGLRAHRVDLPDGEDISSFFSAIADAKDRFLGMIAGEGPGTVSVPAVAAPGFDDAGGGEGIESSPGPELEAVKEEPKEAVKEKREIEETDLGFTTAFGGNATMFEGF
jgi:DNA primase